LWLKRLKLALMRDRPWVSIRANSRSGDTDVAGSADFDVSLTPEPYSFLLLGAGVLALGFLAGSRFHSGVAIRHYLSFDASR
jgi:hypothetical protein